MSGRVRNTQRQNQLANQIVKIYLADGGRRKKKRKTRRRVKPKKEDEKQTPQLAQMAHLFPRFVGGAPSQVSSGVTSQQINEKLKTIEDRLQAVTTARALAPPLPAAAAATTQETTPPPAEEPTPTPAAVTATPVDYDNPNAVVEVIARPVKADPSKAVGTSNLPRFAVWLRDETGAPFLLEFPGSAALRPKSRLVDYLITNGIISQRDYDLLDKSNKATVERLLGLMKPYRTLHIAQLKHLEQKYKEGHTKLEQIINDMR